MDSIVKAAALFTNAGQLLVQGMTELSEANNRLESRLQEFEQRIARQDQGMGMLRDIQTAQQKDFDAISHSQLDLRARLDEANERRGNRYSDAQEDHLNERDDERREVQ